MKPEEIFGRKRRSLEAKRSCMIIDKIENWVSRRDVIKQSELETWHMTNKVSEDKWEKFVSKRGKGITRIT